MITSKIIGTITDIVSKTDKNGIEYLVLSLDSKNSKQFNEDGDKIFLFLKNIKRERWNEIDIGTKYEFSIRESYYKGKVFLILQDFSKMIEITS